MFVSLPRSLKSSVDQTFNFKDRDIDGDGKKDEITVFLNNVAIRDVQEDKNNCTFKGREANGNINTRYFSSKTRKWVETYNTFSVSTGSRSCDGYFSAETKGDPIKLTNSAWLSVVMYANEDIDVFVTQPDSEY